MIFPRINLNGTSEQTLLKECRSAYDAVVTAREKLSAMTVHGRDYQTYPDLGRKEFCMAQNEHFQRLEKLRSVEKELADLYANLSDQTAGWRKLL